MSVVNSALATPALSPSHNRTQPTTPERLHIRFTQAHDCERVHQLFNSQRKRELDPNGKVRARSREELADLVAGGSAIMATDKQGQIRFFGMASDHFKYTGNVMAVTELGGIMSDVRGFKLTQVASAMLALRESIRLREQMPGVFSHGLHALVARDNVPAQKIFGRDLGWHDVEAEAHVPLFETQGKYTCPQARASKLWYSFQASAMSSARNLVTNALSRERLTSKNGEEIPITLDEKIYDLV